MHLQGIFRLTILIDNFAGKERHTSSIQKFTVTNSLSLISPKSINFTKKRVLSFLSVVSDMASEISRPIRYARLWELTELSCSLISKSKQVQPKLL